MADTNPAVAGQALTSYEAEMNELRGRLAGRPYCRAIGRILPDLTKAQIRNIVNGRGRNDLVLAALKIVLHKLDSARQQSEKQLAKLSEELAEMGVAA